MASRRKRRADELAAYLAELEKSSYTSRDKVIITGRGLFAQQPREPQEEHISDILDRLYK